MTVRDTPAVSAALVCPGCGERFTPIVSVGKIRCPKCGGIMPTAAPAAAKAAPAPRGPAKAAAIQKACPKCGARYASDQKRCPECGANYDRARLVKNDEALDPIAPEKKATNAGVAGGLAMIAIAAIWFFVGMAAGYIYFYPPILAVVGIVAIAKGLTGDSGK